ncbi:preprotein translocase subunit SecY [Planctomycetaceae bacterium SH139]
MFEKLRIIFSIPELRLKIFITLALLALYRIGFHIPLPMINADTGGSAGEGGASEFFEKVSLFAASDLRNATIFGLGIMPYISASIIFQLLGSVWKPIEELRKEGEAGRKKINEYTRYLTVLICLVQSYMYLRFYMMAGGAGGGKINPDFMADGTQTLMFGWQIVAVLVMTCGTVFLMWVGEQIDEYGIGNGISLLIMAGILAQMPQALYELIRNMKPELVGLAKGTVGVETLIILVLLFVTVVFGVVFITLGQRRIPTQSAKFTRGRRVYGGTRQFLPLRINQAGVMPIIFASSLLMIPGVLFGFLAQSVQEIDSTAFRTFNGLSSMMSGGDSFLYNFLYVGLIFFFCYFWTAITFNPKEMSDQLRESGTFIPGHRPGRRTSDYLEKVMVRITYVGSAFLAIVAIVPTIVYSSLGVSYSIAGFYGGTGLLIAVSVAFDLIQKIDSHLVMRNYRGMLES